MLLDLKCFRELSYVSIVVTGHEIHFNYLILLFCLIRDFICILQFGYNYDKRFYIYLKQYNTLNLKDGSLRQM